MFRNFTPHSINIHLDSGEEIIFQSEGSARVSTSISGEVEIICGIPVAEPSVLGDVVGLPDPELGVLYIVSLMVAQALKGQRNDLVIPATGPSDGVIMDSEGKIIGVRKLARV